MSEPRLPADPSAADAEHDAWLREALRHAPDSALAPPPLLRDSILSQARAAVAPAPPARRAAPPRQSAFAAFWLWLARPPVAAGFASVMAATLVGLMWWDRPMDEAMPQPPAPVAAAPAAVVAAPAALAPTTTTTTTTTATATATATPTASDTEAATATTAAPSPVAARRAAQPAADLRAKAAVPGGDAVAFPAEAKEQRSEDRSVARDALKKADEVAPAGAIGAAAPAPAPAPAPGLARVAPASPRPAPALADVANATAEKDRAAAPERARQGPAPAVAAAPAPVARLDAARDADASAFAQAPPRGEPKAAARRSESAAAAKLERPAAPARPLAPLLSALADDAGRVTRVVGDGRAAPVDDATRRWLAELDAATAGLWRPLDAAGDRGAVGLDLRIDGEPAAAVSIEATTVTLAARTGAAPRLWRAEVGAAAAERLRTGLPR